MFNFNLQNKAFEELNAEQFKLVYFLNNTLSMVNKTNNTPNNNIIEMYNGYMMDKLGLSERQVQRLIKRLEQLEYITVERATRKNQPNIITLIFEENNATDCTLSQNNDLNDAINCDKNCDKNVTLNKNKIKNNKNNNITTGILELKDLGPKVTEENKKEKNNKKEKLSYQSSMDVKVSEPDNKIISFKKMMKENEMSDNGTNVMNAISEQSERQTKENESSGCDKINEMTTSKSGDQNKIEDKVTSPKVSHSSNNNDTIDTSNSNVNANKASGDLKNPSMDKLSNPIEKMEPDAPESPKTEFKRTSNNGNGGHKVQSGKVIDDCSIFDENCPKPYPPQIPPTPPFPLNKAAGDLKNTSMEQLPTNEIKTRQNAPESPQIEFDEKWYNETYALMDNFKTNEDLDELYTRFKQCNNKRMINDFKCKVWKRYDLDNGIQNKLTEMFREFRRMIA